MWKNKCILLRNFCEFLLNFEEFGEFMGVFDRIFCRESVDRYMMKENKWK